MNEETVTLDVDNSQPYIQKAPVDDIISSFCIDETKVKKYEEAVRKSSKLKDNIVKTLVIGYIVIFFGGFIVSSFSIGSQLRINEALSESIFQGLFILFGLALVLLYILRKIARNRMKKLEITHSEAVYHNLARSIESHIHGDTKETKRYADSAHFLLENEGSHVLNESTEIYFNDVLRNMHSDNSEINFEDHFDTLATFLIDELSTVHFVKEANEIRQNSVEERESKISYPYHHMISDYVNEKVSNPTIRRIWPYIVAAPFIVLIYMYVGGIESQIVTVFYIGVVEKLHDPS